MADRPTPYSIAICTLIVLQSDPTSPLHQEFHPSPEAQQCLSSFLEERVSLSPLHGLSSVADGLPGRSSLLINAVSMSDFFSQLKSVAAGTSNSPMDFLCKLLLDYVSMAASSVDGLVDLMQSLRHAVLEGIVDSNSAHGVFLRKVCLGFDLLSFETVSLLWSDMQQEIKFAKHSLDEGPGSIETQSGDETKNELVAETGDMPWPLSSAQIEGALRKECFRMMETKSDTTGEKIFSYEEVEVNLRYVLSLDPELPAAHFLRFLNCIKHGERVGAMDALHRYFDYAIIQGDTSSSGTRGSDTLQFAAILLAASHHSFGDSALAKLATDEAVKVAQQSMDASCVAFALGWIFTTNQNGQPDHGASSGVGMTMAPQAGDLLLRCATRAMEGQIWSLAAGSNLTKTRYHLLDDSAPTSGQSLIGNNRNNRGFAEVAWNCLADASSQNGTEAADDGAVDRPTHVTDTSNYRDVMTILARQSLVSGGVWDYFGQRHLSGVSSFVALYCHANNQMLSHDVVSAIQNISRVSLYGSPSALVTNAFRGKALEEVLLDSGSSAAPVTSCVYSDALVKLISCWKQFNLPMDGVFLLQVSAVLQEWAVRRGELSQALAFGSVVQGFLHPRIHNYWQLMIDIMSVKSLMLARQEKWEESQQLLLATIQTAKVNHLRPQHASLLLQLSLVHLDENPLNFTLALPTLLECLTLTDQYKMDGLHACALSVLAQVHFRMRNATRAIALLKAALPSILQTEHVWYQGEAFLTLSKCRMQMAGICFQGDGDGPKAVTTNKQSLMLLFRSAVRDLRQSQHFFEKCHDLARLQEVFYLQARVLDQMPREHKQRDEAAQAFVNVSQYLTEADKPCAGDDGVLNCLSSMDALLKLTHRPIPAK